ncbi:phosphotransferase enzyme family protein [Streptomyces sp. TLI_185]|uniref:phosphotransferase enzyme family protein n=1 Tax=Streptomyces sp. TLI_185 TaxID=2485151 RepID=UPI000F4D80D5|nr:aminoglycoside phosphotransferase family protein [Streptomyces sp. TLI_185]RPF38680.1 phosphotransferase family enzyme [Streptomyces sp. TLI_185]
MGVEERSAHGDEQPLSGGNVSDGVVRIGDTVRRPAGPWTPAVHALLTHLHEAGFHAAPRPLGIDDQGREVLTFVPGRVIWPDRFALVEPTAGLVRVARLVRDFHDAVKGFTPPPDARWQVLVPAEGADIIAHQDLAPWNLVVGGEEEWSFIDWDTAAPGSRLWDVAYAIRGFVPLSAHPDWRTPDAAARLRLFAHAYGLDETERRTLVPMLGRRTRAMHDFLRDQSDRGHQPWARLWAEGHGDAWRGDAEYIEEREEQWERALLSG